MLSLAILMKDRNMSFPWESVALYAKVNNVNARSIVVLVLCCLSSSVYQCFSDHSFLFPVDATSPTASATVVFTPSSIVTVVTETPPPRTPSDGDDMPIDSESTETGNSDDTPSNEGTPSNEDTPSDMPSNNGDTPSNNEEVNPTRPSNQIRNLVLLLNIPYKEVKSRWEQFSSELADKLREKKITLEDISIMPDVSSTV